MELYVVKKLVFCKYISYKITYVPIREKKSNVKIGNRNAVLMLYNNVKK